MIDELPNESQLVAASPVTVIAQTDSFCLTSQGLEIAANIRWEEYQKLGEYLKAVTKCSLWSLGDWLIYATTRIDWKDRYTQAMDASGLDYQTVQNARWVASKFPDRSRRRENLTFTVHAEVAGLEPQQQERLLDQAEAGGWTTKQTREKVRELRQPTPVTLTDPPPKYDPKDPLESVKTIIRSWTDQQRMNLRFWLTTEYADEERTDRRQVPPAVEPPVAGNEMPDEVS